METNFEELSKRINHLEFLLDSLMLEFCPENMTESQKNNWETHQRKSPYKPFEE